MEFQVIRHGSVDSTSERAFAALRDGNARHGDVHVADEQTAGRGRQGRRWHSPRAGGLYASVVLLPSVPFSAAGLTIAAGLAVHDAVVRLGIGHAALDWPNDVVVRARPATTDPRGTRGLDAKIAGILVETRGLDPHAPHYVIGIGLNVAQSAFPAELSAERAVTSLHLEGCTVTRETALAAVLEALPARLDSIRSSARELARDYLAATMLAGARVRVRTGECELTGRIDTLDIRSGLVIVDADGRARTLALEVVREIASI